MKLNKLVERMRSIEDNRQVSADIVISALKEALEKAFHKQSGIQDAKVRVDIDEKHKEIKVYQQYLVVEKLQDDELEISLEDAKKISSDYELGDYVDKELDITQFSRAAAVMAKNVMKQKIREAEKEAIYEEYCDKVHEMVVAEVETVEEKFVLVNLGKAIATLPKKHQIPNEKYVEGSKILVVIVQVNRETKGSQVLVSRADPVLVKRLFEKEVPEIYDGIVEIKAIAREAGERTKIAVFSHDVNVDPIGACIGPKGQRVQHVIDDLKGEKIDIFEWSDDVSELIKNSLSPAEILAVIPHPKKSGLIVVVANNQLSLAIGKKGKNARLAYKLTGNKIDIKSEAELEEAGIDWKAIALKQKEEAMKQKELERQLELEKEEELAVELEETLEVEEVIDEEIEAVEASETNEVEEEKPIEAVEEVDEDIVPEMEEAARIAKERQRSGTINIKEKQEYVSRFEDLADASKKQASEVKSNKSKKNEEGSKSEQTRSIESIKKEFSEVKIVYSEEELAEIERQQLEEEEKSWIHDDIDDYEEYEDYYDEE